MLNPARWATSATDAPRACRWTKRVIRHAQPKKATGTTASMAGGKATRLLHQLLHQLRRLRTVDIFSEPCPCSAVTFGVIVSVVIFVLAVLLACKKTRKSSRQHLTNRCVRRLNSGCFLSVRLGDQNCGPPLNRGGPGGAFASTAPCAYLRPC